MSSPQSSIAPINRRILPRVGLISAYFLVVCISPVLLGSPKDEVGYYIEAYGQITPEEDYQVAKTHAIFERVKAAADTSNARLPRLVIVKSPDDAWIYALPDGYIVMTVGAVRIAHTGGTEEEIEARLAFMLGHELAHLAYNDFSHREKLGFRENKAEIGSISKTTGDQIIRRELQADDLGYVYSAISGYPVSILIQPQGSNAETFFDFWANRTNMSGLTDYPKSKSRAEILRRRLKAVHDKLAFFEFGVRLSHFDYCDDAVYFFREFLKEFPGREVLNNLGYCYMQMARQNMEGYRAYFYWMPSILDIHTRARPIVRGGSEPAIKSLKQASGGKGEGFLREAKEYFFRATASDPQYLPARLNLAVAHLYLGQPHQARAVLTETLRLFPDNLEIQILEALAVYEQSDAEVDLWPTAVSRLEKLARKPKASLSLIFNLARLLEVRPRANEAQQYWNKLAESGQPLPAPVHAMVCTLINEPSTGFCDVQESKRVVDNHWQWPLEAGSFERFSKAQMESKLAGWHSTPFDWFKGRLHGHIYRSPDETKQILVLNGYIQMQVIKIPKQSKPADLQNYCSRKIRKRMVSQGVIWSCDDRAILIMHNGSQEIWRVAT